MIDTPSDTEWTNCHKPKDLSTGGSAEWLKLTVDPRKPQPFGCTTVVRGPDPTSNTCGVP